MNQIDEGKHHRESALGIWTELADEFPKDPQYRWEILRWFIFYESNWGQHQQAERFQRRGLEELDKFATDFPEYSRDEIDRLRMSAFSRLGKTYFSMGFRDEESEQLIRKSMAIQARMARSHGQEPPHNHSATSYLAKLALR